MSKCLQCQKDVVSEGKKPVKYCSDKCRMAYKRTLEKSETNKKRTNEQETNTQDAVGLTNEHQPDTTTPPVKVLTSPKGRSFVIPAAPKTGKAIKDLPEYIQVEVKKLGKLYGDLAERTQRALHYQSIFPDKNTAIDGDTITDAMGNKHPWPGVLDTVNTTGRPRVAVV